VNVSNELLIIFGGANNTGKCFGSTFLYHVEQKKFEKLSIEGPKARKDHTAVFIGKTMYIFGGRDNEK